MHTLWLAFGGLVFLLMGLSLACDAETHARSVLQWQKSLGQGPARRRGDGPEGLVAAYRFFGATFIGVGLWLLGGLFLFHGRSLERVSPPALQGAAQALAGALFCLVGLGVGGLRAWTLGSARSWSFIDADEPRSRVPFRRRVAAASRWLLIASFVGFGLLLLRRSP
jgi:hypothetical protein